MKYRSGFGKTTDQLWAKLGLISKQSLVYGYSQEQRMRNGVSTGND